VSTAPDFCPDEVHDELRAHPERLLRLRPWPETESDIGECPTCFGTLHVEWPAERRTQEAA